ncbi:MAG TPA: aminoglycoside phosphotransferase family protein [Vicinamibacterales bacterium]
MTISAKPPAEVSIDAPLVRALLQDQHPDLAHLSLEDVGEGWDNKLFRLGDSLAVRLPRRAAAATLIAHEQRWLGELAPRLPLPIPVPRRIGLPGRGYPWSWSVTSWFPGRPALLEPPHDFVATGIELGSFLAALHRPAPDDAPLNPWRGIPLAGRAASVRTHLARLGGLVDQRAALDLWQRALAAPAWSGPPLWLHGDLHPGNLVIFDGHLSAIVDFGDLTAGDPATDLSVMWMLLPGSARSAFVEAAGAAFYSVDRDIVMRARGWALALSLAYLANSRDDGALAALGSATLSAVLSDD